MQMLPSKQLPKKKTGPATVLFVVLVCCVAIERSFLRSHLLPVVQLRNLVRNSPSSSETASSRHHVALTTPNTQPEASISAFRSGSKKRGIGSRASKVSAASCTPFTNLQSPQSTPPSPILEFWMSFEMFSALKPKHFHAIFNC